MMMQADVPQSWGALFLSLFTHLILLFVFSLSLHWKVERQLIYMPDVELWQDIPAIPHPPAAPPPPIQPEPKPEPVVVTPASPPPPPAPDMAVQEPAPSPAPRNEKPAEPPKPKPESQRALKREALDALKAEMTADSKNLSHKMKLNEQKKQLAEAHSNQIDNEMHEAIQLISQRIRQYVNTQVCGKDNISLQFRIALMPSGNLTSPPVLVEGSNLPACNQAVERAILQAQPLPIPQDPELFARLRNLNLKFKPNEDN